MNGGATTRGVFKAYVVFVFFKIHSISTEHIGGTNCG